MGLLVAQEKWISSFGLLSIQHTKATENFLTFWRSQMKRPSFQTASKKLIFPNSSTILSQHLSNWEIVALEIWGFGENRKTSQSIASLSPCCTSQYDEILLCNFLKRFLMKRLHKISPKKNSFDFAKVIFEWNLLCETFIFFK